MKLIFSYILILFFLMGGLAGYGQAVRFKLDKEKLLEGEEFALTVESRQSVNPPAFPDVEGAVKLKLFNQSGEEGSRYIQLYQTVRSGKITIQPFKVANAEKTFSSPKFELRVKRKGHKAYFAYKPTPFSPQIHLVFSQKELYVGEQAHLLAYLLVPVAETNNFVLDKREVARFQAELLPRYFVKVRRDEDFFAEKDTLIGKMLYRCFVLEDAFIFGNYAGSYEFKANLQLLHLYLTPYAANAKEINESNSELRKEPLASPTEKMTIKPLPENKPLSFAVGEFQMRTQLSDDHPFTGDPLTLKINIEGSGNIEAVPPPMMDIPPQFYRQSPEVLSSVQLTRDKLTGVKHFYYEFYPTQAGDFEFGPIAFYFFNTAKHSFDSIVVPRQKIYVRGEENKEHTPVSECERFYESQTKSSSKATPLGRIFVLCVSVLAVAASVAAFVYLMKQKELPA